VEVGEGTDDDGIGMIGRRIMMGLEIDVVLE